jgi:Lrp/AsnC family transcriptional regulator, regulator for asnA, asnC and gidA
MKEKIELDHIDVRILQILNRDGRRSFTDLSQDLGVSVGMVRNRYNRLVEHGILHIIGWTDPVKNGMNAYARVMLKVLPTQRIHSVAATLAGIEDVSFVAITTGAYDLEINITCRSNEELLKLMSEQILTIEGVNETSSTMYLKILKWAAHNVTQQS